MTKEQFLKRCETIYDMGLADEPILKLLDQWVDAVMRYEGGQGSFQTHEHQLDYWRQFVEKERKRTNRFANNRILANDVEGYKIIQLAAILAHPRQCCAEDKDEWHTRSGFACSHNVN